MQITRYKVIYLIFIIVILLRSSCTPAPEQIESIVNFDHLLHLTEEIQFANDTVHIVHIYSEYPDYAWVDAADSGPEGITCVDDVGRAVAVYLRHYELTGDLTSLERVRPLLKFVINMQTEDGQFYNFIFRDYSINKEGITSYKSFGWWAARGVWALGAGYRAFRDVDPVFASSLENALLRSFDQIDILLENYTSFANVNDRQVPAWLIYQYDTYSASTVSELMLGLCEYYAATKDERTGRYIEMFGEALMKMREDNPYEFPYAVFFSNPEMWHAWGNGQAQALATAGMLLENDEFIRAAEMEVRSLYPRLALHRMIREYRLDDPGSKKEFQQIAYNLRPVIVASLRTAEATGDKSYKILAGLLGSWFTGNNVLGIPIYDPETGRCFDGINDAETVNRNSGAESTIEALYSLIELEAVHDIQQYLFSQKVSSRETDSTIEADFIAKDGNPYRIVFDKNDLTISEIE